jgi:multidrug efflux pump subunit AcrB
MSPSEVFIRRPVMTTLVMVGILLFGIIGYRLLPVSDLPNVDFPTILVSASLPGANPDTMASAVATPLERQFSTIAGLDSMSSVSTLGNTAITLQFNLSRNIDEIASDILAAINQATPLLPPGMPQPPSYKKVNPADQPILYLALTSATLPLYALDEYGETLMAQRISMVDGVAQVGVFGSQKYAVRVQLNPDALASRGIGIDAVENAIRQANVNLPVGTLDGAHQSFTLQASGQLTTAEPYRSIMVAYRNGSPVRLGDLGRVLDSVEDDKTAAWYGDTNGYARSIVLAIQRQPGANTVAAANSVKQLIPYFERLLPPSAKLHILFDRSDTIHRSVNDVKLTVYIALVLVVLVIFLFLRNLSATVVPSLALPLAIVGTFAAMYLLGYSVDNLSLMAMTLSIGFVVDDAIVMLENIVRHMEAGAKPFDAAIKGAREIGFTIISMTLSLAAVFIPMLFMGGIIGRLFREFSMVIVLAILISGFVSLSLTPMLCGRFLRPSGQKKHGRFYNVVEHAFDGVLRAYEGSLKWVLRHRPAVLLFAVLMLAATAYLFVIVPKGFIPDEDNNQVFVVTEAAQGASFDEMVQNQQAPQLEARLRALPELEAVTSDLQIQTPQINIQINRDKAATLGITAQQLEAALNNAYGSHWVSTIYAPRDQYKVLMELEPQYQLDPTVLSKLYLTGPANGATNNMVSLSAIARVTESVGAQTINHLGQLPAVTMSFNLKPGVSLGAAVNEVQQVARATLASSISTSFQGTAQAFQSSFSGLGFLLLVAILVIYLVLGILYESFVHPLTILSGLPSAGFGALLTLLIFGVELNMYSFVGLILLIGIVKKNAIMQIDFALAAQREGKTPLDAIYQGCVTRFRPIMMTTFAALMAALPIALGIGSDARRPLGLAVVGGLLFSQLVTLFLTPVLYVYLDGLQEKLGNLMRSVRTQLRHRGQPSLAQ